MSEPLRASAGENEEPRPDLVPYEQVTGDRTRHPARTRHWFHRTAPGTVTPAVTPPSGATTPANPDEDYAAGKRRARHAGTDARPAPEPAKPAGHSTPGRQPVRHLTWEEIDYLIKYDPELQDSEEERYRDWELDMAIEEWEWDIKIDREPEIE